MLTESSDLQPLAESVGAASMALRETAASLERLFPPAPAGKEDRDGLASLGVLLERAAMVAVDDADVEVGLWVERGAEAMDEGHGARPCTRPRAGAMRAQMALDGIEEDAQGAVEDLAVVLEVVAQPLGQG